MDKDAFATRVAAKLREHDKRKSVKFPQHVFHISDDSGNSKDFKVSASNKNVIYTFDDVKKIIDACTEVICEAIAEGEEVRVRGFGGVGLKYREPRSTKSILTGEYVAVPGQYVPRFYYGKDLKLSAKLYELSLNDTRPAQAPLYDDDDFDPDADGDL